MEVVGADLARLGLRHLRSAFGDHQVVYRPADNLKVAHQLESLREYLAQNQPAAFFVQLVPLVYVLRGDLGPNVVVVGAIPFRDVWMRRFSPSVAEMVGPADHVLDAEVIGGEGVAFRQSPDAIVRGLGTAGLDGDNVEGNAQRGV